ncbi:hypothetical protein PF008_g31761 [Phytophthora fragariae]|uniref:Uncharacterized protein n=1 Tax=Phytophthora fragariae TaxID=53985 RepID=A0A6G0Q292_9STRA|nr:hypothetical protein PF008_g31761 [Phytophthora fragariae]
MASCGSPAARFVVVWWRAWRWWRCLRLFCIGFVYGSSVEAGGGVRAADRMLQLPSSKVCGCWWRA